MKLETLWQQFKSVKCYSIDSLKIDCGSPCIFPQSLLKKHEYFESEVQVHRGRVADIEKAGNKLVDEVLLPERINGYLVTLPLLLG